MIERCRLPRVLRVTLRAVVIELTRQVGRIGCRIEFRGMTIPARLKKSLELVIHVALVAGNGLVSTYQRERGCRMTECRRLPHRRGMAGSAVMVEVPYHMVRVRWLGELCCVAWVAVCVLELVIAICVTGSARGRQMGACQR
jgi:hypothetical protein